MAQTALVECRTLALAFAMRFCYQDYYFLSLRAACWWAAIKIHTSKYKLLLEKSCYSNRFFFFPKSISKQTFNKIIVLDDNVEFMVAWDHWEVLSQNTRQ